MLHFSVTGTWLFRLLKVVTFEFGHLSILHILFFNFWNTKTRLPPFSILPAEDAALPALGAAPSGLRLPQGRVDPVQVVVGNDRRPDCLLSTIASNFVNPLLPETFFSPYFEM